MKNFKIIGNFGFIPINIEIEAENILKIFRLLIETSLENGEKTMFPFDIHSITEND